MLTHLPSDDILARYPGPVVLYPRVRRWQFVLAINLVFVGLGLLLMAQGHRVGLYVALAFGLVALIPAMVALPGAAKLVLDGKGFRATSLYRGRYVPWDEASEFQVAQMARGGHRIVVFDDAGAGDKHLMSSTRFAGHNSALPDGYGMSHEELAFLLNRWRERALGQGESRTDEAGQDEAGQDGAA